MVGRIHYRTGREIYGDERQMHDRTVATFWRSRLWACRIITCFVCIVSLHESIEFALELENMYDRP